MSIERIPDRARYRLPQQAGGAVVTVGRDDQRDEIWPVVRAEKWAGKAWMELSAKGYEPIPGRKEKLLDSGRCLEIACQSSLRKGRRKGAIHQIKTGSLEWDVVYESASDLPDEYVAFDVSTPAGLTFHYQGELSREEIDNGDFRPDNVVGSYAVYWPQSGRYLDKNSVEIVNYQTGKFGHLYRPLWKAANGETCFGSQLVIDGELRVYLPKQWIAEQGTAAFPLVCDPTFGYETTGGTVRATNLRAVCGPFAGAAGTVTALNSVAYLDSAGTTLPINCTIYDEDSGVPNAKVHATGYATGPWTSKANNSIEFAGLSVAVSAQNYYLGIGNQSIGYWRILSDDVGTTTIYFRTGVEPDPWTYSSTRANAVFTVWATYAASSGATVKPALWMGVGL